MYAWAETTTEMHAGFDCLLHATSPVRSIDRSIDQHSVHILHVLLEFFSVSGGRVTVSVPIILQYSSVRITPWVSLSRERERGYSLQIDCSVCMCDDNNGVLIGGWFITCRCL